MKSILVFICAILVAGSLFAASSRETYRDAQGRMISCSFASIEAKSALLSDRMYELRNVATCTNLERIQKEWRAGL